jgi:branched-chain amino acid transport system substrate-binding protein
VPTLSPNLGQGEFFDQQHVPYFGWGLAFSYCHAGYGFAVSGCLLPETPTTTADNWARTMTTYYKEHKRPKPWSVALVQEDTPAGKTSTAIVLAQFQDNGFKVTYAKPSMPGPPAVVGDFSPYVDAVLTSNNGKAPSLIVLQVGSTNAFAFVKALKAAGYTGDISLAFYDPRIAALLKDTLVITPFAPFESDAPAMKQLIADVKAFKPDVTLALAVEAGYLSADMFIKAMQKVGKNPTPEKLQKVASTMTYKLQGVQCPTTYPKAWKQQTGGTGMVTSNGTNWEIVVPYTPVDTCAPILQLKGHPKSV